MADQPSPRLDEDDTFGRDFNASPSRNAAPVHSGEKRPFGDLDDDEDDVFASKKGKTKVEESAPGAATGMILSLRESLQNCKDNLASSQVELEAAKSEIQKWHSTFQNIPAVPAGTNPEPVSVVTYLNNLKSSEESLKEQLEKAKKREAAFIVTFAKREQEIAELKSAVRDLKTQLRPPSMQTRRLLLDPAIHEEFTRLKNLAEEKEKKIKELQENVAAVNFTPSSKHGKMLTAKCRTLQEENEEIGAMASEGKIHDLGTKIAVLKTQNNELRNQFDGMGHTFNFGIYYGPGEIRYEQSGGVDLSGFLWFPVPVTAPERKSIGWVRAWLNGTFQMDPESFDVNVQALEWKGFWMLKPLNRTREWKQWVRDMRMSFAQFFLFVQFTSRDPSPALVMSHLQVEETHVIRALENHDVVDQTEVGGSGAGAEVAAEYVTGQADEGEVREKLVRTMKNDD